MTPEDARRILGLKSDDDPNKHFASFADARERIAEMVRKAPNETLAVRYQDGLIEFDKALAVIREDLEAKEARRRSWAEAGAENGQKKPVEAEAKAPAGEDQSESDESPTGNPETSGLSTPAAERPLLSPFVANASQVPMARRAAVPYEEEEERRPGKALALVLVLLAAAAGGGAYYWTQQNEREMVRKERIIYLENLGPKMIEARQWPEAVAAYDEMEALSGPAETVTKGRRSIEAGMNEEQTQFVGYWSGEALAAFEAGRWEDAEDAAHKVLEKYPTETETAALLTRIEQAKVTKAIEDLKKAARESIQRRQWDAAEASVTQLAARFPDDPDAPSLLREIRGAREKEQRNRARAQELFAAAQLKDRGKFDREAMDWLREATALAPEDKAIASLYEKMASYTRTLHVPGDFSDLNAALKEANDRDRIVLGEGSWPGALVIDKAVSLEGAGADKTIIEVDARESSAVTFGPHSKGARISGISLRQTSFDNGENRFPVLLVRAGEVTASDCRFVDGSGHGVAVVEGGTFMGKRCTFDNNGWDGISARGTGSRLELVECESNNNFGHGYDVWDGAAATIQGSKAFQNSRNGLLIETTAKEVVLEENDFRANREFGMVVSSAASGRVRSNFCHENLLGGLVLRFAAARLTVEANRAEKNAGPGLVLEQGLPAAKYGSNTATANGGGSNTVANVDFSSPQ